ncbi:MAG: sialate O-acetylesterase [Candidatus Omnitrophica bacterium]|jgi:sialate O-acetylesterase|nr:sialate O-acetylesterase [Candidatus Omnitrophota bacterium]
MKLESRFSIPCILSDNMVLQRGKKINIWGWAEPEDQIYVEFSRQQKNIKTDKKGKWSVFFEPELFSCLGKDMFIYSKKENKKIQIKNILIGDVWVCSGQSNMEWPLDSALNAEEEIENANYPNIRLFSVPLKAHLTPDGDVLGHWTCCSPETVGKFSAVGYFFGREIHRKTGIPIGLINSSWGGTIAEAWTSREVLISDKNFKKVVKEYEEELFNPDSKKIFLEQQRKWGEKYDIKDLKNQGEIDGWHNIELDNSEWRNMSLPGNWQSVGHNYSGIFWFRKEIQIPGDWKGKALTLSLGPTDKSDITYFNGVKIGSINMEQRLDAWCTPRIYTVPGKLVNTGKNVISVRVFSNIYQGGFIGRPLQMKIFPVDNETSAIPLAGIWKYRIEANFGLIPPPPAGPRGEGNANSPYILFDNMIKPLIKYRICGAIWYQGESNVDKAKQYRILFSLMIKSWRKAWKQGNFPFLYVQLANYMMPKGEPSDSAWAELREAQTLTLSVSNTGMAVAIDIGEAGDIHPRNKQDVGIRLSLPALDMTCDFKNLVYSGPIYKSMLIEKNKIRIKFDYTAGGLICHGKYLKGFSISGKNKKFVWAEAVVENNEVVISSPKILKPVAVRYAWADNPECNLYNSSGLPASPFRTDNW